MARAMSLLSTSAMIQALCSPSMHPQSACERKWDPVLRKTWAARRHAIAFASCGTSIRNLAAMGCPPVIVTLPAEPSRAAARAEVLLVRDERQRRLVERSRGFGAREEIHVHPRDPIGAELNVTGSGARVLGFRLLAAKARDQIRRDRACRPLGEHARLGGAGVGEIADRVDPRVRGLERARLDRDPALVVGQS